MTFVIYIVIRLLYVINYQLNKIDQIYIPNTYAHM